MKCKDDNCIVGFGFSDYFEMDEGHGNPLTIKDISRLKDRFINNWKSPDPKELIAAELRNKPKWEEIESNWIDTKFNFCPICGSKVSI